MLFDSKSYFTKIKNVSAHIPDTCAGYARDQDKSNTITI